ncbi:GntR family transcriptional regulator [Novosphingobium clariflavum]|uniref:GntR family transcriptional regulator n=1 Tax=Novosphingobium clariflavum TaxID=2029884 RepID=A0ABV6S1M7_9SPHN|nr:GntR family transcriptional regulator [Novosphingobium clariflavum]
MNAGATAERVYDRLRHALANGSFAPGARLEPARLAQEFNSSATPIRDALHRLSGERLVETRASDGFHVPAINEIGLRDLFRWNDELVRAALRMSRGSGPPPQCHADPIDAADLFAFIAASSRSTEIVMQVASANARLAYIRQIESTVLEDTSDEVRAIYISFSQRSRSTNSLIKEYHKARLEVVPELIITIFQRNFQIK